MWMDDKLLCRSVHLLEEVWYCMIVNLSWCVSLRSNVSRTHWGALNVTGVPN